MSGFLTPLIIEILLDGKNVKLFSDFQYQDSLGRIWTVPAGTITDGASIPRELWSAIGSPFTGLYRRAAVLHDFLYQTRPLERLECDRLLLEAMLKDGTDGALAKIIYEGVRLGGWKPWKDDQIPNV